MLQVPELMCEIIYVIYRKKIDSSYHIVKKYNLVSNKPSVRCLHDRLVTNSLTSPELETAAEKTGSRLHPSGVKSTNMETKILQKLGPNNRIPLVKSRIKISNNI